MKKISAFILVLVLLLSAGCGGVSEQTEPTTAKSIYVTDVNGKLVPAHDNVSESELDAAKFIRTENGRVFYDDESVETLTGIDVSVFQGDIDWTAVAQDGIDFVMLRVGFRGYGPSGKLYEDEKFRENYEGAAAAGLKVGVYFFSQAINPAEAKSEARFVSELIADCDIAFPVAFDWEYVDDSSARTADMTSAEITPCAAAFCAEIKNAGYEPVIYFNCDHGYFNYELSEISGYHFWLAEYSDIPSFYYDYKIWQYSEKGTVAGIEGNVDLNISVVDYSKDNVS